MPSASPAQNEYCRSHSPTAITLTRRHHPLAGQALELVQDGPRQLVVRLHDGTTLRVPRAWTDVDGPPPEPAEESVFIIEALRALLDLVARLRDRA
jgi:hypothetical protein